MARAPVIPWDYYERERRRLQATPKPAPIDPVAATVSSIRQAEVRAAAAEWPKPSEAAQVNLLSRQTGAAPAAIQGQEQVFERYQTGQVMANFYRDHPLTAQLLYQNPRIELVAQGDTKALGLLASAWDTLKKVPATGEAAINLTGIFAYDTLGTIDDLVQTINYPLRAGIATLGNMTGLFNYDPDKEDKRAARHRTARRASYYAQVEAARPEYTGPVQRGILQGLESVPLTIASLLTRNPAGAAGVMGGAVGSNAYMDARDAGLDPSAALRYGVTQGGIETLTERIPAGFLLDALVKKTPLGKSLAASLAAEIPGEQLATVLQDFTQWATLHPEKPFSAYLEERPAAALQTLLGTVSGTAVQVSLATAAERTTRLAGALSDRVATSRAARRESAFIDQAGRAAEDSEMRRIDPEAYAELVRKQGEQSGVTNVFVPAEVVREYMQSDSYDAYGDPFRDYVDQVEEAYATGGDVVLPVEFALATLPGTSAWAAIKDDIRLSPGGMSAREADDFDSAMEDVLAEISDQMAQEEADTKASLTVREKLVDSVAGKLQNAGFTPYVARQQAEFIAQRISTRAARLGQEIQGNEFDTTDVVQVLPPALAEARRADATDLVINSIRRSSEGNAKRAPSLLQWIVSKGGIEDRGGDIAAMGGDKWHKEKPFRKKLLKAFDEAQGNMLGSSGANVNSIENLFDAAISEGFFPELLSRRENGAEYGDKLDVGDFLAAIGDELSGRPTFATEARDDRFRAAADELRELLSKRGLDPDSLNDAELRAAIDQLGEESGAAGYGQEYGDGPRGRIMFSSGRTTIELFQSRNLSTLIHELSHQWLEELRFDAADPDAPEQLKADWKTVEAWFKANGHPVTDGIIPVEAHEMWARGGERYVMEGKAPSSALKRLFETFRGWLISVYKTVDALRSPITPEIRAVFNRLVATDEEIAAMADQQVLAPLFKDAASIGMTGAEFDAYTAQLTAARDEATSELLAKTMASVRRRVTKEYNDQRRSVEAEVANMVDSRPLFRALRNLKSSPMDADWIRDEFGEDALNILPRRVPPIYRDGGAHPSSIAEMSGFDTAREMIETMIGAELAHRQAREGGDKRTLRDRIVQTETDVEMDRRGGDVLTDGSIEREALAAVHNEMQGEVFAAEVRALARKTGQRPTPYRIARDWARGKVLQGTYAEEASPGAIQRHQRAVAKAGRDAEKAMLAGKFDEAFRFKQQQMVSSALLSEAKSANDEVAKARKRMDRIAKRSTMKSVDQEYLDQAHSLLEAVDLRERSQKSIARQGRWEAWSAARTEEGYEVVVPPSFEATLGQTNWSRLTVENLLGLDQAVQQVIHLGRLKQTLLDNKERRDFDEVVKEAVDGSGNIKGRPPRDLMEPGFADALRSKLATVDAALLKLETVFDWLDGGNPNGAFNRIVFRPVADAQAREQDMLIDYHGRVKALFEAVPAKIVQRWSDKVTLPFTNRETGLPEKLRRHQLIAAALNVGNAGNLQRLADGHGWNPAAIVEYLATELTAEEWQFVQGVWDTIDTLWPEIEALEKSVNGVAPERVEASEIITPYGTLRGGYYPAIYDSTRNYRAEENRGREADLFEGGYTRATTRSSATKARADIVTQPILLDLGVINRHLGEVIHDVTHREAVIQANKFLTDARVMKAVDQALGLEIRQQFRPWIKFVANSWAMERAGNEGFGKWLGKLRANVTAVGLGLRATTVVTQVAGYSNSIRVIGERAMAEGIARMSASPVESFRFVMENSDEVRHRMSTIDRDVRTELARLTASNPASKAGQAVLEGRKFFFYGIGYMDRIVSVPTWLGAYNKALSEGMNDADAKYAADKAVRASQGSAAPKDMAAIQRGTGKWGEALKLMTMFYSFFSAQYQQQRSFVRDATGEDVRRPRNMPRLASQAFWMVVVPPLLVEVLKASIGADDLPDDDEWWTQWVLRKMLANSLGGIPLARDVFEPAWDAARGGQALTPQFSPINRALSVFVDSARDVGKMARGEDTTKATKNILETVGYATGLVPGQVASATQFLVDVGSGDADPDGFGDWVEGLTTGKLEE